MSIQLAQPSEDAQQNVSRRYSFDAENHIHTLDGRPLIGTSTACGMIAKPLTWWASGMALAELGWINPRKAKIAERLEAAEKSLNFLKTLSVREFEKLLQKCYRAQNTRKESAAVTGTDMHAHLERYIKECIYEHAGEPVYLPWITDHNAVFAFSEWASKNVAEFLWSEGHCYSERLWTGGICDAGALLKNGQHAIIDFKSAREAYFAHFVQAGGYALQIMENCVLDKDGNQVHGATYASALIVFPFGADNGPRTEPAFCYRDAFEAAVSIHKLQTSYDKSN